jgi:predicted nucleic-acid-binding protein
VIGLDTNVLVRYLTQDEPVQAGRASTLIENACTRKTRGWIALVVLCELVWVLRGAYRYDKALVLAVLEQLLATAELQVENEHVAALALSSYREGAADFADYVILHGGMTGGCDIVYSFDRKLVAEATVREP